MEFNFFGNKFDINIRHQEKNIDRIRTKKIYDKYNFRIFILLAIFVFFSIIFVYYKTKTDYVIGTPAKRDVIAYKTITYEKDILDKEIKKKILKNTKPEYDRHDDVAKAEVDKFSKVLQNLSLVDLKKREWSPFIY